jgi:hypothetical protein
MNAAPDCDWLSLERDDMSTTSVLVGVAAMALGMALASSTGATGPQGQARPVFGPLKRASMLARLAGLMMVLALLPLARAAAAADPAPATDLRASLNAYAALVDQRLDHARTALEVVAATETARSGDWRRISEPLAVLAKSDPAFAAVWFARPDGAYFTVEAGPTGQSLMERAYFPALLAGRDVEGDLVVSRSTGQRSAIVAVPVRAGGRIVGALGVSIAMEKVAADVDKTLALPDSVMFYALDRRGQIALHRQSGLLFEFAAQLGSPTLTEAVRQMLAKPEGTVHYLFRGAERTAIYRRSDVTGWVYAPRW